MRKLLFLLLALLTLSGRAAGFVTTTLSPDGTPVANTQWYVLTISNNHLLIAGNGTANHIALTYRNATLDDHALWAFVGNETDGYTLYNKAAGAGQVLAAPTNMSANTGGNAYIVLKAPDTQGYTTLWDLVDYSTSGKTDATFANPYLLRVHGNAQAAANNRAGKLAFWTTGTDQGSALAILTPEEANSILAGRTDYQDLFITQPGSKPYRIPAITQAFNGNLIAISDYRPSGADVGYGDVDIKARISKDGGKTWGKELTIANGTGNSGAADCGFGDAAVVADRESNEVLLLSVHGQTPYWNGNYPNGNPNPVARFRSFDGGETWTTYEDITEQIYAPFKKSTQGMIKSLFFGSGRLCQSSRIKVGSHYRVYGAVAAHPNGNRVFYSDDFGETWHVLGSVDDLPAPKGDEPKVEELPNGNVVLSSRVLGASDRLFNIFTYTDTEKAQGSWSSPVHTANIATGVKATNNQTNGEILIVPALRTSDNAKVYVALQSVPFGSGRTNVGIYYKGLSAPTDYDTPTAFASNWEGRYPVSRMGSAYSTMCLQTDGKIAFLYEEETYGAAYTNVYLPIDLSTLTEGRYTLDRETFVSERSAHLNARLEAFRASIDPARFVLGLGTEQGLKAIQTALAAVTAEPLNPECHAAFNTALEQGGFGAEHQATYQLTHVSTATRLTPGIGTSNVGTAAPAQGESEWQALYDEAKQAFRLYHPATKTYLRAPSGEGNAVGRVATEAHAGLFRFISSVEGISRIKSIAKSNAPYLSLRNNRLVSTAFAQRHEAQWSIVRLKDPTAIPLLTATPDISTAVYDLGGRRIPPTTTGIQIQANGKKTIR